MGQTELFIGVVEAGELGGVGGGDVAIGKEIEDGLGEVGDGAEVGDVAATEASTAGDLAVGDTGTVCGDGGGGADEADGFLVGLEWLGCKSVSDAGFVSQRAVTDDAGNLTQAKELRGGIAALAIEDDVSVDIPVDEDGVDEATAADVFGEVVDAFEAKGPAGRAGVLADDVHRHVYDRVHGFGEG
jgi:hypothetical protein